MPINATLQDVADRAAVHRSTVSLALRDDPRISQPVRKRIKSIARRLGYRINPLVSALMQSRRSGRAVKHLTIAYVTNYPTRFGWRPPGHDRPNFFPGAAERAADFGYRLEHFWLAEPGMNSQRLSDIFTVRRIDGIIVGRLPPGQHALDLAWERFSVVALGMTLSSPRLHHVTENHFDTVWQAMEQCRQRGYRRVGFVFSPANDSPRVGQRWLGAYLEQQLRLPRSERLPPCSMDLADEATFRAWFRETKPDALLAIDSRPVIAWLRNLEKDVPRDVGLVELEVRLELGCAGVYYDPAKIGALAVEVLVGILHRNDKGVPANAQEILLTGEWRSGRTLPRKKRAKFPFVNISTNRLR